MKKSFPDKCYDCGVGSFKPVKIKMDVSFGVPSPITVHNLLGKNCNMCGATYISSRQIRKNEKCIKKAKQKAHKKATVGQKRRILWEKRLRTGKRVLFRFIP